MTRHAQSFVPTLLIVATLLVAAFLLLSYRGGGTKSASGIDIDYGSQANTVPPDEASKRAFARRDLRGATPAQIGQYAQEYLSAKRIDRDGSAAVLLSRPVVHEEFTALGLGCLPDFGTVEEPPLALVILKGNFDFRPLLSGRSANKMPTLKHYAALVFDVWSGHPVAWIGDTEGGTLRKALNDHSLPVAESHAPAVCPTRIPAEQRLRHYGETVPGFTTPPAPPSSRENGPAAGPGPSPTASKLSPPPPLPTSGMEVNAP